MPGRQSRENVSAFLKNDLFFFVFKERKPWPLGVILNYVCLSIRTRFCFQFFFHRLAAVNFEYPPPITPPPSPPTPLTLVKEIIFYSLRKVKLVDEDDPLQGLACRPLMAQHVRLSRPATSTSLIILRHD